MNERERARGRSGLFLIGVTLFAIVLIVIVAGVIYYIATDDPDSEGTFEAEQDEPAQSGCWFTPGSDTVTAYEGSDTETEAQTLDGSLQYAIREIEDDALGLELRDGTRVWVAMDAGEVVGECEEFNIGPDPLNELMD